jgi:hypothetical protein
MWKKVHKELENLVNFDIVKSLDSHVGSLEISHPKLLQYYENLGFDFVLVLH